MCECERVGVCVSVSCAWLCPLPERRSGPGRPFPNKLAGTCCGLGRPRRAPRRALKLPATMQAGGRACLTQKAWPHRVGGRQQLWKKEGKNLKKSPLTSILGWARQNEKKKFWIECEIFFFTCFFCAMSVLYDTSTSCHLLSLLWESEGGGVCCFSCVSDNRVKAAG